jgi:hypothetical protein
MIAPGIRWLLAGLAATLLAAPALGQTETVVPGALIERGSVNGLIPLWEQTAVLHPAGAGQVGYGHAQVGLGPVQIGTQPSLDLQETFNLQLKVALPSLGRHRAAIVVAGYHLPAQEEAELGLPGDLRGPGFSSPTRSANLFPVSLAHSFGAGEHWGIHSAVTGLLRQGGEPGQGGPSLGLATLMSWRTSLRWAARLHAGLGGLGVEPQAHAGLSLAYGTDRVALAAGYARQGWLDGGRDLFLVDGALLFR